MSEFDFVNHMQVFIKGISGNTTIIHIQKNAFIDDVFKEVASKNKVPLEELRLIFGGKELERGENKTVVDYKIQAHSTLFVVLRLRGGWNPVQAAKSRKQTLTSLAPYITVTSRTDEPCMITLDDDADTKRAKMPCGHIIGPVGMSMYARSLVEKGHFDFKCPHVDQKGKSDCPHVWEWFMVRHVAALSSMEMQEYEAMLAENYGHKALGMQQCPGCSSFCTKQKKTDKTVQCPICTQAKGKPFEFCWSCLHMSDGGACGDSDCHGLDPKVKMLLECSEKEMGYTKVKCPSWRACPKCGILITHTEGCKTMTCTACKTTFCFVCLQKVDVSGNLPCGGYNKVCPVAPRQTQI